MTSTSDSDSDSDSGAVPELVASAADIPLAATFAERVPELAFDWDPSTQPPTQFGTAGAAPKTDTIVDTETAPSPQTIINVPLARELGLDPEWLAGPQGREFLLGRSLPAGAHPVAQAYSGHQFGNFVPLLGDGRAVLLGDLKVPGGDDARCDIHLKGSGRTPFSRGGDGLAALGPMLREYLISEALAGAGIPTTRTLAVVIPGWMVRRDTGRRDADGLSRGGREGLQVGAVAVRCAASHIRIGSFQCARMVPPNPPETDELSVTRRLADLAIDLHDPQLAATSSASSSASSYRQWAQAVIRRQARLVAQWMSVGFVHGVMNTDNILISGESIDFGPCAFLDRHDPQAVFSSIDRGGRYRYGQQPQIMKWNLARWLEAILPLLIANPTGDDDVDMQAAGEWAMEALDEFDSLVQADQQQAYAAKLGLGLGQRVESEQDTYASLVDRLQLWLAQEQPDHTQFFTALTDALADSPGVRSAHAARIEAALADVLGCQPASSLRGWLEEWVATAPDVESMRRANPRYIARNFRVEAALEAAGAGDFRPFSRLAEVLREPYQQVSDPEEDDFYRASPPPQWGPYVTYCGT